MKNIKNLPAKYTAIKRSWMTSNIFENIMKLLEKLRRKCLLSVVNYSAHSKMNNLTNIVRIFATKLYRDFTTYGSRNISLPENPLPQILYAQSMRTNGKRDAY